MPIIPVPKELKAYGVKGIFAGGCVERGDGSSFRARAHAHCVIPGTRNYSGDGRWLGWICVRSAKRLYTAHGTLSQLLWHETAHIWRRSWTEKQCDTWAWKRVHNSAWPACGGWAGQPK